MLIDTKKHNPEDIGRRIKSARMLSGFSREEFAEKFDISAATLRSWESPGYRKGITEKGALRFIKALNDADVSCSISWIMTGIGQGPSIAKPSFYENEPNSVTWSEEEAIFKEVEYFKEVNSSPVIALIKDRGMEPFYEKNSYVAGNKLQGSNISQLVGLNCIIETFSGNILVRRLQKGTAKGRYTLICLNPSKEIIEPIMTDITLNYAAEIVWYRKRTFIETKNI